MSTFLLVLMSIRDNSCLECSPFGVRFSSWEYVALRLLTVVFLYHVLLSWCSVCWLNCTGASFDRVNLSPESNQQVRY